MGRPTATFGLSIRRNWQRSRAPSGCERPGFRSLGQPDRHRPHAGQPGPATDGPARIGQVDAAGLRQVADSRLMLGMLPAGAASTAWLDQLRVWRGGVDLIVLDLPAMDRSAAAMMLARHVDTTLLVAAAEMTPMEAVAALRDRLWGIGARSRGCCSTVSAGICRERWRGGVICELDRPKPAIGGEARPMVDASEMTGSLMLGRMVSTAILLASPIFTAPLHRRAPAPALR